MNDPAIVMTLDERRLQGFAESIGFVSPNCLPGWSIAEMVASCGIPASEARRYLGILFGQGRVVPFVHENTIRWRRPSAEEMTGL